MILLYKSGVHVVVMKKSFRPPIKIKLTFPNSHHEIVIFWDFESLNDLSHEGDL